MKMEIFFEDSYSKHRTGHDSIRIRMERYWETDWSIKED